MVIILLNRATKLAKKFQSMEKEYTAIFRLGIVTDTWDMEGKVIEKNDISGIDPADLYRVVSNMKGIFRQQPPIFSAKKIMGKPAYYYARNEKYDNRDIILQPGFVNIYSIELISFDKKDAKIKVRCSTGTYIRSLVHEIGKELKCGATLTGLIRNKIGGFYLEDCIRVDEIKVLYGIEGINSIDRFKRSIIPMEALFNNQYFLHNNRDR